MTSRKVTISRKVCILFWEKSRTSNEKVLRCGFYCYIKYDKVESQIKEKVKVKRRNVTHDQIDKKQQNAFGILIDMEMLRAFVLNLLLFPQTIITWTGKIAVIIWLFFIFH